MTAYKDLKIYKRARSRKLWRLRYKILLYQTLDRVEINSS